MPTYLSPRALAGGFVLLAASASHAATTTSWTAGDPASGPDAYTLIQNALGAGSIESPDLGPADKCHIGTRHISEQADSTTGYAFRFNLHQGTDCDPTGTTTTTRERVEIKVFDPSPDSLKAFLGNRMKYVWRFRVDSAMKIGPRFTHVFQLKSTGGSSAGDSHPVLTFTGANGNFEIRHGDSDTRLATMSWSKVAGKWVEASVEAVFSHSGSLKITLKDVASGNLLINYSGTRDMFKDGRYVRPKWGIYRENPDQNLGDASVRFANFSITKY